MKSKKMPRGVRLLSDGRYEIRTYWTDPKTGRERESIETVLADSPEHAAYLRVKLRERKLQERSGARPERERLGEALDAWLAKKVIKPSTRSTYSTAIEAWRGILGDYYLDAVHPDDVAETMLGWSEVLDADTVNGRLRVLRTFAKEIRRPAIVEAVRV